MSTTLLEGHVLSVLASLPAGHFHTVVTSPPYWQLRAYGTPPQTWPDGWVGELGQEETPERFVAHLVAVFSAVKRVLRDDGTLWVNLAGSYYTEQPGGQNGGTGAISAKAIEANRQQGRWRKPAHPIYRGLDWVDVPGLFARAMQAAGWLWRSDVVWVKPSALPESVSGTRWERCRVRSKGQGNAASRAEWADCPGCPKCAPDGLVLRRGSGRPTKATEHIHLYSKAPGYYYDTEAVREPAAESVLERAAAGYSSGGSKWAEERNDAGKGQRTAFSDWVGGRNLRDVWTISPEPLKDAHYAAYPSALPERCIKAGTSEWGCCPACGAPWARCIDRKVSEVTRKHYAGAIDGAVPSHRGSVDRPGGYEFGEATTLGWRPTCRCPEQPPVPARCLDPFGGSGTTALAANRLGRDCTLVELKPQYAALARKRVGREPLSLFATHGDTGGILPVEETEGAVAR